MISHGSYLTCIHLSLIVSFSYLFKTTKRKPLMSHCLRIKNVLICCYILKAPICREETSLSVTSVFNRCTVFFAYILGVLTRDGTISWKIIETFLDPEVNK